MSGNRNQKKPRKANFSHVAEHLFCYGVSLDRSALVASGRRTDQGRCQFKQARGVAARFVTIRTSRSKPKNLC